MSKALHHEGQERRECMKTRAVVAMLRMCTVVAVLAAVPLLAGVATARRSPISCSSWATTSAGSTRRLSPGHHVRQNAEPRQDRRAGHAFTDYYADASCTAGRISSPARSAAHRPHHRRPGSGLCGDPARPPPSPPSSKLTATPPGSSARTTWATSTSSCRRCTASTSSSAICITSTRCRTRTGIRSRPTRRITTRTAREVWCIAGRRIRMMPP